MTSNKLPYTIGLCLSILFFLAFLSVIPEFKIGNWNFKKIDLLSDIRTKSIEDSTIAFITDSSQARIDSMAQIAQVRCPLGITCIEDYSKDSTALIRFFEALNKIKSSGKPLRIAMYGDSFIEGDVFCGGFRDTLQSLFGGNGVGYVPIASEVAGFRRNVKHQFENWETYSLIKKDSNVSVDFGPAGYYFVPQVDNWVEYKPVRHRGLKELNKIKLYYTNFGQATIDYTLNDTLNFIEDLKTSASLQEWSYNGKHIGSVNIKFSEFDSLYVYGASLESTNGIYVDNFSLRGNSGIALGDIPDKMLKSFNRYRNYKLIVLQYGLNVMIEDSLKYNWYVRRMVNVVNKIKKNFPKASVLMLSVSDRSSNTTGRFKTMATIPVMRNAQRQIAQETGIAFWDMFEAMGGENSMVKLVEAKPSLAAKDYTHLTFKGGRKIAGLLVKSLLYEQEKHGKDKK